MPSFVYVIPAFAVVFLVAYFLRRRRMQAAPRITEAEVDAYRWSLDAATLPMARMIISDAPLLRADESRIGGAPFGDAAHPDWPLDEVGLPMLFLAQINFADLPDLPDFPRAGLLQLFVACDAKGHVGSTEEVSERMIRWFPDPVGERSLPVPPVFLDLKTGGSLSPRAMPQGLAVRFARAEARGNPCNWPFDQSAPDTVRRLAETPEVAESLRNLEREADAVLESYGTHWVGGHPSFVQGDVRDGKSGPPLDRVLLHLGFDDDVCLGDAGKLNLLIGRQDLLDRAFQRAFCTWDCG